jgi:predicted Rossmann fold flavoprotein
MCAIEAGKRKRSVTVLDHANRLAKKVRASGGGRCNFTNLHLDSHNYLSGNPHFCKSALARFTPNDFTSMVERHRIAYYEKEKGQLFCCESSGEIVTMLHKECHKVGVEIRLGCQIMGISKVDNFSVAMKSGDIESASLIIATGGLSYPDLGATDLGFRIAKHFDLKIMPPRPALVPLVLKQHDCNRMRELSGVSFDAEVSCNGHLFRDKVLFTHRGLSGPAILQASLYWNKGDQIRIDLLPGKDAFRLFMENRTSKVKLSNFLSRYLPKRLSRTWSDGCDLSRPLNMCNESELKAIAQKLHTWTLKPEGTEGFKKAEVTVGGVDTGELSSKTMETKRVPGLYFVGEVVDVTGHLGGYNLHWAWSSGFVAGQYA